MNLGSVIRETKDKKPDLMGRIKEIQTKERLREMQARRSASARRAASRRRGRARPPQRGSAKLIGAGLVAGSVGYFLDPNEGARRRHTAVDKIGSIVRRSADSASKSVQHAENKFSGAVSKAMPSSGPVKPGTLNDQELAHKVESELFRDPTVPKGQININAEEGIVYLRGTIESEKQSQRLGEQTAEIAGVTGVKNLLHTGSAS